MKQLKHIIPLFILLISAGVQAQKDLSLSDAISIGLENSYDLRITRKSEAIASINNNWGNTGALPSVNFNISGSENLNLNDTENYRTEMVSPELGLNWVVFNGFSARITKRKFEELEQLSKNNTAILIETSIQNIIEAYNSCLLQKEMVDVYKELSDLSEDRYKRAQNSKELGASTTYEMLQAKTSWLEDQSSYLQQKVNYENAVRTLNYAMAAEDEASWEFTTPLETNSPVYALSDLEKKLFSNNQTLKNQYLNQSLLARESEFAKSNFYPTLSLNSSLSNTWMNNSYSGNTPNINQNYANAYIGLSLSFNIFNGGVTKRSVQIAQIEEESSQIQTDQMEHSLSNQLLQLYSNYNVQKAILELANEKESTAKLNLNLSEEKYRNGSINSFNYRDVQIVYMNAAFSKLQAIYNLIQSNTDLLRITGGMIDEFE